jgi:ectoine hydroxylase-related dioxygenase (phytanoyl-CoA dioxygenase family)
MYSIFNKDKIENKNTIYDLEKDGFYIFKDMLSEEENEKLKFLINNNNYEDVKEYLINKSYLKSIIQHTDYTFQDYIWIIKRSSVHTCHRDNNGDFFNEGQKFPSYTMLIYLEDMDKCLGVIPKSHLEENKNKNNFNFTDKIKNLICKKGDVILFNANLIHVGALNPEKDDNLRIQMKVSHKDDINVLSYYENYNKVLNEKNNVPYLIRHMQKNISCMFPIVSDLTQNENISSSRGSENGANISLPQKIFSYLFYGNANFYDLPNAF